MTSLLEKAQHILVSIDLFTLLQVIKEGKIEHAVSPFNALAFRLWKRQHLHRLEMTVELNISWVENGSERL